ncbi:hypothetical protein [Peribacillus sp. SI8-4]|uniref:hypothetical protein n=1 Tax=Peribacillus sp. SI8-4 TaxID=3048009 RepID=UPI002557C05E|nr:hypothetical protein [Peribacillus sp. SI8-4]
MNEHKHKGLLTFKWTNFMQSGSFPVLNTDFKKDPDWTAAVTAYKWIQNIKIDFAASEDFRIDQVIYNGDIEITELVNAV